MKTIHQLRIKIHTVAGDMAVVAGTADSYVAGTITITPTSDSLITITTCFGNNKDDELCTDDDFQLKNTVTVE